MITAALTALLVVLTGARLRPRPARVVELATVDTRRPGSRSPASLRRIPRPGRRRRERPDPADIADWCGRLAASCRAGTSLGGAIRACEPPRSSASPVEELVLSLERGATLSDAIRTTDAPEHLDLALTVVRACADTGGPPAEPLDRAAAALRGRAAEAADLATHGAQARLSAVVMTVLPLAMLALLVLTSGAVRRSVVTPVGAACLLVGMTLNLLGWHWMRRVIDGAAR